MKRFLVDTIHMFAMVGTSVLVFGYTTNAYSSLVAEWTFDNSTNVGKATVGSDLISVGNAAYTASGKSNGVLLLDGNGDYLHLDASNSVPTGIPTGNSSFTITAWINTTNTMSGNGIVGWGNYGTDGQANAFRTTKTGGAAEESEDGLVDYSWGSGYDVVGLGTVCDGQWHLVAITYDSTTATKQLYLDGTALGSAMSVPDLAVANINFSVGATNISNACGYGVEYFKGLLDDVRIYDTALSSNEIAAMAVPEPNTLALLLAGLVGLLGFVWRKRK